VWGIIPAAGIGSRIQPLAFSKELLPVGSRRDERGVERPRAVSEYLVDRMKLGGATKICFVISPGKSDIVEYYGGSYGDVQLCYAVQPRPLGLCDALFRALPFIGPQEPVLVGLPDTVWFPANGYRQLGAGLSFLCFPVARPELFDAVVSRDDGKVMEIQVKRRDATSSWVWGAFRLDGAILAELHALWLERDRGDEYLGTLVNAWLARGGAATAVHAGTDYVDVGTLGGYREAIQILSAAGPDASAEEGTAVAEAEP
jgi:glucose-1-phosphate thymidylyltransferase